VQIMEATRRSGVSSPDSRTGFEEKEVSGSCETEAKKTAKKTNFTTQSLTLEAESVYGVRSRSLLFLQRGNKRQQGGAIGGRKIKKKARSPMGATSWQFLKFKAIANGRND